MRTVWLLACVAALLFVGMGVLLADLQPNVMALQFAYTPTRFQAVLDQWGSEGLRLFQLHLLPDFLMLTAYGAFGYLFARRTSWLESWPESQRKMLGALLPVAALCDALENTCHMVLLAGQADMSATWVFAASALASVKWLLLLAFVVWLALAALRRRGS